MAFKCNIDKTDRINRSCIGLLIFLCGLFGMSATGFMLFGAILFIQGIIGWCSIYLPPPVYNVVN